MRDVLLASVVGLTAGATFAAMHLPVPAPPNLAGAAGVVGVTLGFLIVAYLRG